MEEVVLKQLEIRFPSTRRGVEKIELRVVRMVSVRWGDLITHRKRSACISAADIRPADPASVELGVSLNDADVRF